jgi:hypothetical protein
MRWHTDPCVTSTAATSGTHPLCQLISCIQCVNSSHASHASHRSPAATRLHHPCTPTWRSDASNRAPKPTRPHLAPCSLLPPYHPRRPLAHEPHRQHARWTTAHSAPTVHRPKVHLRLERAQGSARWHAAHPPASQALQHLPLPAPPRPCAAGAGGGSDTREQAPARQAAG